VKQIEVNNKLPVASFDYTLEEIVDLDNFFLKNNLAIIFDLDFKQASDNSIYSDEVLIR
jgi:hypothetical protein